MKSRTYLVFLFFFLLCNFFLLADERSAQKLLDTETFMEMESIKSPIISPDGSQIIFSRTYVDKMDDRYYEDKNPAIRYYEKFIELAKKDKTVPPLVIITAKERVDQLKEKKFVTIQPYKRI